jgi:outer membrane lipoprotein-sorting protein
MFAALLSSVAFALAGAAPAAETAHTVKTEKATPAKAAVPAMAQKKTPAPVTFAAATPAKPLAFAELSDAALADRALKSIEAISTLKGDFTQLAPSGESVSGQFFLRRPGQIRFDYDAPSPITIVATGGMVYVQNDELETTDSYPLGKTPLKFLLSKKLEIGAAKLVGVDRTPDSVAVTYASTDAETEGEITLYFGAPALDIRQWAIRDAQGGTTVVDLRNVRAGERLENRLFRAPEAGGTFINN